MKNNLDVNEVLDTIEDGVMYCLWSRDSDKKEDLLDTSRGCYFDAIDCLNGLKEQGDLVDETRSLLQAGIGYLKQLIIFHGGSVDD